MNNGAHKGTSPEAWQTVRDVVGPDKLWQLHYAVDGGPAHNVEEKFIANPNENPDSGYLISAVANSNGAFSIVNSRNNFRLAYPAGTSK